MIKTPVSSLFIRIFLLIIATFIYTQSFAGDNSLFIDMDGDGFNDTPPTISPSDTADVLIINPDSNSFISFEYSGDKKTDLPPVFSSYFELRRFETRALARNRCNLDADLDFGPGSATGNVSLSGAGSICSGGSCHR